MKSLAMLIVLLTATVSLTGCPDDASVAKQNMNKAADNFVICLSVVMFNSIRNTIMIVTEGKCSVEDGTLSTSVICKVGPGQYIRNFYGKSDNTVYFVEQMEPVPVNVYHYRRTFKPQTIIPDIDFRGSAKALGDALTPDSSD